jgi:parvulin-like peptidyl-prolyl isomerase
VISRTLRRSAALAVVGAVLATGCSSTMEDAATVRFDDRVVHITRADLEDDLEELRDNEAFRSALEAQGIDFDIGDASVSTELASTWLGIRLFDLAVSAELEERDIELTDAVMQRAEVEVADLYLGPDAFAGFSEDFRRRATEMEARRLALFAAVAPEAAPEPTEADAREVYDANVDAITACPSGKEVAHILVEERNRAEELRAELEGGAAFADLAREHSTDGGSAAAGGSLGCLGATPFVEPFQEAADQAALDTVVGPVETDFGFHLILVTAWDPQFEDYRDAILEQLRQQAGEQARQESDAALGAVLDERYEAMDVRVDPRYGTWGRDEQGRWLVTPPEAPEPRDGRGEPGGTDATDPAPGESGDVPGGTTEVPSEETPGG